MLNLNDLNSSYGSNFFDASGVNAKRAPDEDDEDCDELLHRHTPHRLPCHDSVGSRSLTSPWEYDFPPTTDSHAQQYFPSQMGDLALPDSGSVQAALDRPYSTTHEASFAILGDQFHTRPSEFADQSPPDSDSRLRRWRMGYVLVALMILACIGTHVLGLLVYFTPWYYHSIQVAIFRRFYSSFSESGFQQSVDAKRSAVAVVYLLAIGIVPTVLAAFLWFTFSSEHQFRRMIEIPQWLKNKPVFFARWSPVYVNATMGEIMLVVVLVVSNGMVFICSLLRSKTVASRPTVDAWRDVGGAFAFNAMFNLVWLLLFLSKPSPWNFHLEFFGIADVRQSIKYRNWFGFLALASATLHVACIIVHLQLAGDAGPRLFPGVREISTNAVAGSVVLGEIAFGSMFLVGVGVVLGHVIPRSVTLLTAPLLKTVSLFALCIHYPATIAWVLPTLMLFLIQEAVASTHSRYPVELVDMAPLPNGVTRIVLRRNIDKMDASGSNFVPGQVVYVRLPRASWLQWHRCTVASAPARNPGVFTIYAHSPITRQLTSSNEAHLAREIHDAAKVAYAKKAPPIVYVDGFYGPSHPIFYEKYQCLVLVAGGIGVVETLSMLEQLYHDAWLAASDPLDSKIMREFIFDTDDVRIPVDAAPAKRFSRQVWFLWTCDDVCLYKEFEDLFFRIKTLDPSEMHFKLRFFLTKIPLHEDIQYQRIPSADFSCDRADPTSTKQATRGLLADAESTNPCRRPPTRQPQNRSSLSCCSSRPFQQAVAGVFVRSFTLMLVAGALTALTILIEWSTLRAIAVDSLPLLQLLRDVMLLIVACVVITRVIAIINDGVLTAQRTRQEKLYNDAARHIQRTELSAPSRGLKKLRSVAKMDGETENDGGYWVQTALDRSSAIGPDVMERLMIYSMRPDVDKFMRTVGRAFPRFAGTIGVFTSGENALADAVEGAILSCEAAAGEWKDIPADFAFHRLG